MKKVQDILDALYSSQIVEEIEVMVLVQEPGRQALRAVAKLKGDTSTPSTKHWAGTSGVIPTTHKKRRRWCEGGTTLPTGQM